MTVKNLPMIANDNSLGSYLRQINQFPVLEEQEEMSLAKRLREKGDVEAAHKLVTSHLRLAASIALGFRHYGLPISDLISEANIGLMHAVKKFEPKKGNRLSTYAMWWIKASLHEFVIKSWSLVKMGTVAAQKKLFYNLRKIKAKLGIYGDRDILPNEARQIAKDLDVDEKEVVDMNRRISGDSSLNARVSDEGDAEKLDFLTDETPNQEQVLETRQIEEYRKEVINRALDGLKQREQEIIRKRKLLEDPLTLEELGKEYGISRERVRQIEARAYEKFADNIKNMSSQNKSLLIA